MDHKQWIRDVVDSGDGQARGINRAGLARVLGRSQSAVNRLLDGDQELKVSDVAKIASYLEVEPPPFHRTAFVPLLGKVAGGRNEAVLFGENGGPVDWIALPARSAPARGALEVEGDSMRGIAGHGFIAFIGEKHAPPTPDQVDQLCVCGLPGGQRVVKFLHSSKYPDRFDLLSSNDEPMLAQAVEWAAIVTNIVPATQAGTLARRSEADDDHVFLNFENRA
ncbi:helix-turn-helix transcriptional regulator [uncultured Variovorax sp.]|uniref:helix-turn-helix domain-containing protein n=1 Tax=uncultured Variovorax sp. TaxID=114708 RepID=UPI002626297E|nr:helix-turn-helix transcriptional regulator [uncultured Variovorax sp.]